MKFVVVAICLGATLVGLAESARHPLTTLMDLRKGSESRIISGQPVGPGQIPWQACLVVYRPAPELCGGSLISDQWVLTAAHCLAGAIRASISLGSTKWCGDMTETRISQEFKIHENFDRPQLLNDIGLIKLPEKVQFSNTLSPIRLPPRSASSDLLEGRKVFASGFGHIANGGPFSSILLYANLNVISNAQCETTYGASVRPSTICAIGHPEHSTCQGDSGGPLFIQETGKGSTLVGVVSFSHKTGCDKGYPSGHSRVTSYLDWIGRNTGIAIQD